MKVLAISLCLAACHSTRPRQQPLPPPPVITVLPTPACDIPELPDMPTWGGVPQYDANGVATGWQLITLDGLGEVDGYLDALTHWTDALQRCLKAGQ